MSERTNQHVYGEMALWLKGKESTDEARMAKERRLTVILRAGDRSSRELAEKQFLPLNTSIPVYYIAVPGDQDRGIAAQFESDVGDAVKIVGRTVVRLGDIKDAHLSFQEGTAVVSEAGEVRRYLEEVLSPGKSFGPESLITIYWVEYLDQEEPAND